MHCRFAERPLHVVPYRRVKAGFVVRAHPDAGEQDGEEQGVFHAGISVVVMLLFVWLSLCVCVRAVAGCTGGGGYLPERPPFCLAGGYFFCRANPSGSGSRCG